MAGLTLLEAMPCIKRMRKAGRKTASDIARIAWKRDLVKIVRFRTGPAILNMSSYLAVVA